VKARPGRLWASLWEGGSSYSDRFIPYGPENERERPSEEITGFARTCGPRAFISGQRMGPGRRHLRTGGDGKGRLMSRRAVAFVAAGGGCTVAKHQNRSVSSQCGSADVLEALGVDPALPPERAEQSLHEFELVFLFAPAFHPATKHAAVTRRGDRESARLQFFSVPSQNPAGSHRPSRRHLQEGKKVD